MRKKSKEKRAIHTQPSTHPKKVKDYILSNFKVAVKKTGLIMGTEQVWDPIYV